LTRLCRDRLARLRRDSLNRHRRDALERLYLIGDDPENGRLVHADGARQGSLGQAVREEGPDLALGGDGNSLLSLNHFQVGPHSGREAIARL
jgi:hypothetical protein